MSQVRVKINNNLYAVTNSAVLSGAIRAAVASPHHSPPPLLPPPARPLSLQLILLEVPAIASAAVFPPFWTASWAVVAVACHSQVMQLSRPSVPQASPRTCAASSASHRTGLRKSDMCRPQLFMAWLLGATRSEATYRNRSALGSTAAQSQPTESRLLSRLPPRRDPNRHQRRN